MNPSTQFDLAQTGSSDDWMLAGAGRQFQSIAVKDCPDSVCRNKDDTLRARAQKLQARRAEILLEMATLKDGRQLGVHKIDTAKIEAFCEALKARMTDAQSGLGKAYLRLLVDEIRLEGDELKIRGSYRRLADAVGLLEKRKLGEVPSFIPNWRARGE